MLDCMRGSNTTTEVVIALSSTDTVDPSPMPLVYCGAAAVERARSHLPPLLPSVRGTPPNFLDLIDIRCWQRPSASNFNDALQNDN